MSLSQIRIAQDLDLREEFVLLSYLCFKLLQHSERPYIFTEHLPQLPHHSDATFNKHVYVFRLDLVEHTARPFFLLLQKLLNGHPELRVRQEIES